jgi:hypothetical protein
VVAQMPMQKKLSIHEIRDELGDRDSGWPWLLKLCVDCNSDDCGLTPKTISKLLMQSEIKEDKDAMEEPGLGNDVSSEALSSFKNKALHQ